jgi:hypothetical protein
MSVTALDSVSMSYPRSSSPCCEAALDEILHSPQGGAFCTPSKDALCNNVSLSESMHFDIVDYNLENLTSEVAEINTVELSNLSFQSGTCDDSMEDIFGSVNLESSSASASEKVEETVLDMEECEPYTLPLPASGSYYTTVFIEKDTSFLEENSSSQTIDDEVVVIPQTTSEESLTPTGGSFGKVFVGAVISVIALLLTGFAIYRFAA